MIGKKQIYFYRPFKISFGCAHHNNRNQIILYLFNCFLGFFNSYFYNYFRLRIPQENNQKSTQNNLFSFTRPERGLSQTHCKKNSMLTLNCQATNSQEKIKSRFEKPIFNKKILWHVKP